MTIDQDKLNEFLGKAVADIGAAWSANMVLLGDKLGLYKAMAGAGPVTPAELARLTNT
ncbi:SAM-dependent methyltransferase, partial [Nitrospirales bacterium NOB]|nr:SAM-dependent methyltransferase [Nitrospirales bacterium NOB]